MSLMSTIVLNTEQRTPDASLSGQIESTVAEQIADHIKALIASHGLKRHARLPSYRQLAVELDVAVSSAMRGVDLLVEQGIVRRQRARGCYVNREMSAQGRTLKTIGIMHTSSTAHLFSTRYLQEIIQGIGDAPVHRDIQIYSMRGDGFVTAPQLADRHVDGVILLGLESDAFVEEFATWGLPGVLVDQVSERVELDCVACDNATAARCAVQHLVDLGHRHIRYVGCDPRRLVQVGTSRTLLLRSSDRDERRERAVAALSAVPGLRWNEDLLVNVDEAVLHHCLSAWRGGEDWPAAVLTDDVMTAGAVIRKLASMGIAVPGDVSVCAIASMGEVMPGDKMLTGNRFDFIGMGRKAVELLRRRCEEPTTAPAPHVYRVGSEWVEGRTCGARA